MSSGQDLSLSARKSSNTEEKLWEFLACNQLRWRIKADSPCCRILPALRRNGSQHTEPVPESKNSWWNCFHTFTSSFLLLFTRASHQRLCPSAPGSIYSRQWIMIWTLIYPLWATTAFSQTSDFLVKITQILVRTTDLTFLYSLWKLTGYFGYSM